MSYILDALRRADAERERGAVPGIHAQPVPAMSPDLGPRRGGVPVAWVAAGGALLVAGALAWQLASREREAPAPAAAAPVPAPRAQPAPRAETAAPPEARPAVAAQPETRPAAAVPPVPRPAPMAQPAPRQDPLAQPAPAPAPSQRVAQAPRTAAPPTSPTTAPAPVPDRRVPSPAATAAPMGTGASQGSTPTAAATEPDPPGTPPLQAPPAANPRAASPQAAAPKVHRIDELPPEVRNRLPALSIGGSRYSPDPAKRFLIVNGQLLREKEAVAPDVTLEEIRLRGAVLRTGDWRYAISY